MYHDILMVLHILKRTQKSVLVFLMGQPSKLNFSFGGHLATNSLGLVANGFF